MSKRVQIVANPASGQPRPILHTVNSVFREADIEWDVSITRRGGDAYRYTQEALTEGVDVVAAFGGDGTVLEAASAMVHAQAPVPLAILPGGTANVAAIELGIPRDLTEACQVIANSSSTVRAIDVGQVSSPGLGERVFLLRADLGFTAEVVMGASRELKDQYGQLAYTVSALQRLRELPMAHYCLTLDGQQVEVDGVVCRVDNAASLGIAGLSYAPGIDIADGLLDVVVLNRMVLDGLFAMAAQMPGGEAYGEGLYHWQVREATIEADPPQHIAGDGEVWGQTPFGVRVLPQAVAFLAPEEPRDERQRFHVLQLLMQGWSATEISARTSIPAAIIHKLTGGWSAEGKG